jgi:hypothetical protein
MYVSGCWSEATGANLQKLLSLLVALRLAVALAVLLVGLGSLVGSSSGNELVRELSLVLRSSVRNLLVCNVSIDMETHD